MRNDTTISPVDIRPKKTRHKTETEHQKPASRLAGPQLPTNGLRRFSLMPPASHTTLAYNTWPGRQGQRRCLRGLASHASQPLQVYCPSERSLVQYIHDGTVIPGSATRHGKSVQFVLESSCVFAHTRLRHGTLVNIGKKPRRERAKEEEKDNRQVRMIPGKDILDPQIPHNPSPTPAGPDAWPILSFCSGSPGRVWYFHFPFGVLRVTPELFPLPKKPRI